MSLLVATVTATDKAGATTTATASTDIATTPPPSSLKTIGYFAPAAQYASRLQVVGPNGVKARRIYADLVANGQDQSSQIVAAHNAGMLPIVSYKLGGVSISAAATGAADAAAQATANYLASFNKPTVAVIWHEPYDDMSAAQFVAMQRRLVPFFKVGQLQVGPILHGWLLDRQRDVWEPYLDDQLLDTAYDFVGIDTYQSGSASAPGNITPGDRVDPLNAILADRGHANMPIGIGEYNGYTEEAIASAGEKFLSTPNLAWACMFDNTTGVAVQLSGARLAAYQATKSDPRARQ